MRKRILAVIVVETLTLLTLTSSITFAEELKGKIEGNLNALNSGYAITTWPSVTEEYSLGDNVTVRAATTEPPFPEAVHVVFRWHKPDGSLIDVGPTLLTKSNDTWDGKPIWDAYDTQTLDVIGEWGVQALFIDEHGKLQGPNPYAIVAIKATSCTIIPEISLNMFLATFWILIVFCAATIKRRKGF